MIRNVICMLYIFCFVFKPAHHLKTQESSQTFIPFVKNTYLQNISSMFGSSMKRIGVGSSALGRHPNLSIHAQAKCRIQLPKELNKEPVTTEGPGLGRGPGRFGSSADPPSCQSAFKDAFGAHGHL